MDQSEHVPEQHAQVLSLWPIGVAVGVAFALVGLLVSWWIVAVGAVIIVLFGAAWIFDLTRALGERDGLAALAQLGRLISQGEHPLRILATVGAEVRRLIAARQLLDGELAKVWRRGITFAQFQQKMISSGTELLGRSMFGDYLSFQRADRFSLRELSLFMRGVFEADALLKSAAVDPRIVLERLFLDFCLQGSLTSGRESVAR